ncbi:MAG TPA: amidohydrolase [Chitinophagaceae bacterium]|nr:amidohydrolase [Chitinophagaceae bacterium]
MYNKIFLLLFLPFTGFAQSFSTLVNKEIEGAQGQYSAWYQQLHKNPELSTQEMNTAAFLKKELSQSGFTIIDSLGFHSFAAVLKNGNGPVVLYRTDMDGLPVKEQTGLPFASEASYIKEGQPVSAMHACGHDIHMSSWLGTATLLSRIRKQWSGTVIFLAQSAEETGQGARKIIASPSFARIPKPDIQLAFHDNADLPSGQIGFCDGYSMAAVDMMNITIYGKGGHGAAPQQTIDPVLLSAQYITAIQSIVSRNLSSNDPAVITVGAIHGGTVGNIIPDQVQLKLTIRSFSAAARQTILDRLKTIGDNMAAGAGLPKEKWPQYELLDMSIKSVYNDPQLGARLRTVLSKERGDSSYTTVKPIMIGEDFGEYGQLPSKIPSYLMWIGTVSAERKALAAKGEAELYSLHSSLFAPDYAATIPAAVKTMSVCILHLLSPAKK